MSQQGNVKSQLATLSHPSKWLYSTRLITPSVSEDVKKGKFSCVSE
jgi:hypothetical protein